MLKMNKLEIEHKPLMETKPIQGFMHFIELFRIKEKNSITGVKAINTRMEEILLNKA